MMEKLKFSKEHKYMFTTGLTFVCSKYLERFPIYWDTAKLDKYSKLIRLKKYMFFSPKVDNNNKYTILFKQ